MLIRTYVLLPGGCVADGDYALVETRSVARNERVLPLHRHKYETRITLPVWDEDGNEQNIEELPIPNHNGKSYTQDVVAAMLCHMNAVNHIIRNPPKVGDR